MATDSMDVSWEVLRYDLIGSQSLECGTSPTDVDSDDDDASDAIEYPLTGAPVSDPCSGPNLTCTLGRQCIFSNGFE